MREEVKGIEGIGYGFCDRYAPDKLVRRCRWEWRMYSLSVLGSATSVVLVVAGTLTRLSMRWIDVSEAIVRVHLRLADEVERILALTVNVRRTFLSGRNFREPLLWTESLGAIAADEFF